MALAWRSTPQKARDHVKGIVEILKILTVAPGNSAFYAIFYNYAVYRAGAGTLGQSPAGKNNPPSIVPTAINK
jgi:hypothetical protein